jgi:hypothetical protein
MLEKELEYFAQHQEEYQRLYPGKFVVIKGNEFAGAFNTVDEAVQVGARTYGLTSFLVRQSDQLNNEEITAPALALGILRANSSYPARG